MSPVPFAPPSPPSAEIVTKQMSAGTATLAVNPGVSDENNVVGAPLAEPDRPHKPAADKPTTMPTVPRTRRATIDLVTSVIAPAMEGR